MKLAYSKKLNQFLKELGFIKKRGISTTELLHVYFLTIIEKGQSINGALQTLCLAKYKTPLNDFINNYNRKWCRLLSRVSRMSMSLHSGNIQDNKIIIDDTKKEKSGKKADSGLRIHLFVQKSLILILICNI